MITFIFLLPALLLAGIVVFLRGGGIEGSILQFTNIFNPYSPDFLAFSFSLIVMLILLMIVFIIALLGSTYSRVLLAALNLDYIEGKKLEFKDNHYFNFTLFSKYLLISLLSVCIIFAPVVGGVIIVFIILLVGQFDVINFATTLTDRGPLNYILAGVMFFFSLITVYLGYRLTFAHFVLVENKDRGVLSILKRSFSLTRGWGHFWRFVVVILPLTIMLIVWNAFGNAFDSNVDKLKDYLSYEQGIVQGIEPKQGEEFFYYEQLKLVYGNDDFEELGEEYRFYTWMQLLFFVCNFSLVYGLFELLIAGFYKRRLILEESKRQTEL